MDEDTGPLSSGILLGLEFDANNVRDTEVLASVFLHQNEKSRPKRAALPRIVRDINLCVLLGLAVTYSPTS